MTIEMTFESLMTLTNDSKMTTTPWTGCLKTSISKTRLSEDTVSKTRPRTMFQSQTIRKALGQRNTTKLCLGLEEHCSFKDSDAKTVDGTICIDTNLALEILGSKGPN
jgi:hypothetical protein